jgi:hypothetical protein
MHVGFFGQVTPEQIEEFKTIWPNYIIKCADVQSNLAGFDAFAELKNKRDDLECILWEQTPLETLVDWIWRNYNSEEGYSDDSITNGKFALRELVPYFNVIFFFPTEELTNLDAIRRAMVKSYEESHNSFFPTEDCPAVITIAGPADLRIKQLQLYLTVEGQAYEEEDAIVSFDELEQYGNN